MGVDSPTDNDRSMTGGFAPPVGLRFGEIECRADLSARITGVMGTSAQPVAPARPTALPLVRRNHVRWLVRAPGQRGALSPEEVAHALKTKRAELRRRLDWRRDVAGMAAHAREECVDEAIGLVVMSRKPIHDEEHLQGAFWTSIGYLLMEYRSGRRDLHVGSRHRVNFEPIANVLPDGKDEPFDLVAARERVATAADLMAQLDPFEQRVVAVMAAHDLGVKRAAKAMGEPIKTVLAASRSAQRKLDQVAAITAAGRMCDYRQPAIHAHAQGVAQGEQAKVARAHLAACPGCRSSYAELLREMNGRDYKRAASAAFLPPPMLAVELHGRWLERLSTLLSAGRAPSGSATAERTAGLLGGGGLVKAAAATSALVIAGAGVGARVVHSLEAPGHSRQASAHAAAGVRPPNPRRLGAVSGPLIRTPTQTDAKSNTANTAVKHRSQSPPSHELGYLALGASASKSSSRPRATAADAKATSHEESPAPRAPTGGGTNLNYLGE